MRGEQVLMKTWSSTTSSSVFHSPADCNAQLVLCCSLSHCISKALPEGCRCAWTSWGRILHGSGEVPVVSALRGIPCCGRRLLPLTQTSPKPPGKASSASCSCRSSRTGVDKIDISAG